MDAPDRDRHFHDYTLTGLQQAGLDPLTVYFTGSSADSILARQGHKTTNLDLSAPLYKNFNPVPIFRLFRLIKRTGAKIVHVHRHRALIYAGMACLATGTPLIYSIRSTQLIRNRNRRFAFNCIKSSIARIIAVSRGAREDYLKRVSFDPDKVIVVSNGIEMKPYKIDLSQTEARRLFSLPRSGFIFGMAARFKKAKDHVGLVKAFSAALEKMPDAWLALAGDGPREQLIREAAAKCSVGSRIVFTGRLDAEEIPFFLKSLDVFVHPSFREGMPASVLEAMAAGLPIISTDAEGVTDIFDTEMFFGRMVKRGDIPALTSAIIELRKMNGNQREKMGRNAQTRLKQGFTREHMVGSIVDIYNEVLTENRTP